MLRTLRVVCYIALLILASLAGSGAIALSRSEVVDDEVMTVASAVAVVTPRDATRRFVPPSGYFEYPAIDRWRPRDWDNRRTDARTSFASAWWLETTVNARDAWVFQLLVIVGAAHAMLAVRWAWPHAKPGRPASAGRFAMFTLRVILWSAPAAVLTLFFYWPLVSLWGSIPWITITRDSAFAWIINSVPTRVCIGAGLVLCYSLASLFIARRLLNAMIRRGGLVGVLGPPTSRPCTECAYLADAPTDTCPECGKPLRADRRVLFVWPRCFGTPARRRRRRIRLVLAAVITALLSAPLLSGVCSVLVGAL